MLLSNVKYLNMLCYKRFFFSAISILSLLDVVGQNRHISIAWEKKELNYTLEQKQIAVPTFKNAIHSSSKKYVPTFATNIPINGENISSVTILNAQYANDAAYTGAKDILPSIIEPTVNVFTVKRQHFASIAIPAIRNNNGIVERLQSFDIAIQSTNTTSHRGARSYASNSALANGQWRKIAIGADGIYKMDFDFIKNTLKLDVAVGFDKIGIFGNGGGMVPEKNNVSRFDDIQENAILRVDNNGNNKMDADDYILFYAQGADKWFFDPTGKTFSHQKNLYADKNFYFVTNTQGTGKALLSAASEPSNNQTASSFDDYRFHESEEYNPLSSGRVWLGDKLGIFKTDVSFSFDFPNLVTSSPITFTSNVDALSIYTSTMTLSANGQAIATQNIDSEPENNIYRAAYRINSKSSSFFATANPINFNYNFNNPDPNNTSNGYIDYLEVVAKRMLVMTGSFMPFRNAEVTGPGNITQFTLSNANANTRVWDVTDPTNATNIQSQLSGSSLSYNYNTSTLKEFIAVDLGASFGAPEYVGEVANQDLHGIAQKDLLIVTSDDLLSAAQELGAFHTEYDNMKVAIVTTAQIYNEFGSGKQDISAIRDFVKMFYDRAGTDTAALPKYLTLFGDGSFDPKDRISDNNNKVPTYQSYNSNYPLSSYTSDDFFGCLDPSEGGDMNIPQGGDIAIGRLPVANLTEANGVVNKIKKYKSAASLGDWRNIITTIGDEIGHGGPLFQEQADKLGEYVRLNNPNYNVEKIILDAYKVLSTPGGDRYPDVNASILNKINNGTLAISYTGHGGISNLSNARIFNLNDIQLLKNEFRLPLFITATCEFSKYDDPEKKSAGEFLMTNEMGGGIGLITTVRPVFSNDNDALQNALFSTMFVEFHGRKPTMGELMTNTKNMIMGSTDMDNTRKFVLLGDAALTLNYPQYNVVTTKINNSSIVTLDTLKALKRVTITGEVQDWSGAKLTSFNGTCYPKVYDKLSNFTTLGNVSPFTKQTFNTYKSIIFKGACTVTNGEFEYSFIVPSDINYQIGDGRISYYADNGDLTDAHGYNNDIKIGGASDTFTIDTAGPQVALYMDSITFEFGGITDENPKMFGILEALGGINTTGNGLGHDITATFDGDAKNPIILNEYYRSDINNFRKGKIEYPFSKLSEGRHSVKLKAWDIYNNSGEAYTEFIVSNSAKLALTHVLNYPNPVLDKTCFSFEHNCADEQFTVNINIYDVQGMLIKQINQTLDADGYRVDCIEWDGTNNSGGPIGKGVYIYKLVLIDAKGSAVQKTERLVVLK